MNYYKPELTEVYTHYLGFGAEPSMDTYNP
jgi:hypothetical protein